MGKDLMYDLENVRNKMKQRKSGSYDRGPNEFVADKIQEGAPTKQWGFFVLPPVDTMDLWFYEHGYHWIDNKKLECPRIHDGIDCPLCSFGFDKLKEIPKDQKEVRRGIIRKFLSSSRYAVNIYFPTIKQTPEDLRDKNMWFSMPITAYNICEETIMRDPPSDDVLEPEPYGIFFDPNNAMLFALKVKHKGGYNNYESSNFIMKKTPIAKSDEKIEKILEARFDIPSLFGERKIDELQEIVDRLKGEEKTSESMPGLDEFDLGDDDDEKEEKKEIKKESKKEEKKESKEESNDSDDLLEGVEDIDAENSSSEEASVEEEDEDLAALLKELDD